MQRAFDPGGSSQKKRPAAPEHLGDKEKNERRWRAGEESGEKGQGGIQRSGVGGSVGQSIQKLRKRLPSDTRTGEGSWGKSKVLQQARGETRVSATSRGKLGKLEAP